MQEEEDRLRVDWMEKNCGDDGAWMMPSRDVDGCWWLLPVGGAQPFYPIAEETLRGAIDAAMAKGEATS